MPIGQIQTLLISGSKGIEDFGFLFGPICIYFQRDLSVENYT